PAYVGPSMMAEIEALKLSCDHPERPVAAVIGGSKVSTKIDVLVHLVKKMNFLIVGGGMANTFLYAKKIGVGRSLCEPGLMDTVDAILSQAAESGCRIVLPVDAVVASELKANVAAQTVAIDQVPDDMMILDIGPRSVAEIAQRMESCRTLLWNGPVGA